MNISQVASSRAKVRLSSLIALGFDVSYLSGGNPVATCQCCAAAVINGVPCHESGCPKAKHECRGCNTIIPANRRWCQDCQ